MQITITKRLEWDSGHRVLGHEGKCKHLHGHRYAAEITCTAPKLDSIGRVIDFSVIKETVGGWIDKNWDHNMILHEDDPLALWEGGPTGWQPEDFFGGRTPYVLPNKRNTTVEELSSYLLDVAGALLQPYGISVIKVKMYETPTSSAEVSFG